MVQNRFKHELEAEHREAFGKALKDALKSFSLLISLVIAAFYIGKLLV